MKVELQFDGREKSLAFSRFKRFKDKRFDPSLEKTRQLLRMMI